MNKRGQIIGIIFTLALIALAIILIYMMFEPQESEEFILKTNFNETSYSGTLQFHPNMRFPKKILAYNIDPACQKEKHEKMLQAFSKLENETILKFQEKTNPDILVSCQETQVKPGETFIAGEGGARTIIKTDMFYVIQEGEILLLYKEVCDNYNVELHELLHVLGFKHSNNPSSLMYNLSSCYQQLTQDILDEINRLYSIQELPDLYLTNVSALKHSAYFLSYLDFSLDVKNQGLAKAENIILELYSGNEKIEKFELGNLSYGEGKYLYAKNIKFSGDKISFVVKAGDELDLSNNKVELYLQE